MQTELGWLLDDALAAMARPGGDWRPTSWRQLERDLRLRPPLAEAACQYLVQLREPLEALGEPWRQEQAWLRSTAASLHRQWGCFCAVCSRSSAVHAAYAGDPCLCAKRALPVGCSARARRTLGLHAHADCALLCCAVTYLLPLQPSFGSSGCGSACHCSTSRPRPSGGTWYCQVTALGEAAAAPWHDAASLPARRLTRPAAASGGATARPGRDSCPARSSPPHRHAPTPTPVPLAPLICPCSRARRAHPAAGDGAHDRLCGGGGRGGP